MANIEDSVDLTKDEPIVVDLDDQENKTMQMANKTKEESKYGLNAKEDQVEAEEDEMLDGLCELALCDVTALEDLIDSKLMQLGFEERSDKAMEGISRMISAQERRSKEVGRIILECKENVQKFKELLEVQQAADNDLTQQAESGNESDDDVQFVEATYEPKFPPKPVPTTLVSATPGPLSRSVESRTQVMLTTSPAAGQVTLLSSQLPQRRTPDKLKLPVSQTQMVSRDGTIISKSVELAIGMKLLGKKFNDIWYKGTLIDIQKKPEGSGKDKPRDDKRYKLKFDGKGMKILTGKHIAFYDTPNEMVPVGSRIVALYKDGDSTSYYAGIVAESPSVRNSQRYLIFFDDGYAQYCLGKEIHKVYEQSINVWEDIHPDSQEFIKGYLAQYPERPMVRLQKNQIVKTEWNGRWWTARVVEVDASLVKMFFDADEREEWIYRGSTRLEPLYTELANAEASKQAGNKGRRHNLNIKSNKKPFVEYTRGIEEQGSSKSAASTAPPVQPNAGQVPSAATQENTEAKKRSVAKKSTGGSVKSPSITPVSSSGNLQKDASAKPNAGAVTKSKEFWTLNQAEFQASSISRRLTGPSGKDMASVLQARLASEDPDLDEDVLGERMDVDRLPIRDISRKKFKPHICGPSCIKDAEDDPMKFKGHNPLLIPMLCGWERQVAKVKTTSKRVIFYRAPCCRRLRSLTEVDKFLSLSKSRLAIDLFCFDMQVNTHSEFVPLKTYCDIKDLSYGKENVPISCVNAIDRTYPDYVEYSNQRLPARGVKLNLEKDFLACCDCTDNCRDKSKCACCQLSVIATAALPGGIKDHNAGYEYRRLREPHITGVYECNANCPCDNRCHNRVAQNGLQLRLQLFKTERKGWGLRCLDDIPSGGFICIYAGQLLTEQGANEDGHQYGDEYLAELDHIEVVERLKEGYESDAADPDADEGIGEDADESDGSEVDRDSDSTYSGERRLNKSPRRRRRKDDDSEKVEKIVLTRDANGSKEKEWCVKSAKDPNSEKKTADWIKNLPEDLIVISDEEENSRSARSSANPSRASPSGEELPDLDIKPETPDVKPPGGIDKAADSDLDSAGTESKKQKPSLSVEKVKSKGGSTSSQAGDVKDEKMTDEASDLQITEPTSLNTDNVDSDDSDDTNKNKAEVRRTTRSQTSRFRNLPDPKSQTPISPLKIKLSTLEVKKGKTPEGKQGENEDKEEQKYPSTRLLYGGDENCYVMDAKSIGNIGRYLNHSCSPNVFVQNVFVDTHDLRFPWVAFFALQYIRAGTELTWDYNYEVGSVPGKVLYCYCSSAECRGRLL